MRALCRYFILKTLHALTSRAPGRKSDGNTSGNSLVLSKIAATKLLPEDQVRCLHYNFTTAAQLLLSFVSHEWVLKKHLVEVLMLNQSPQSHDST